MVESEGRLVLQAAAVALAVVAVFADPLSVGPAAAAGPGAVAVFVDHLGKVALGEEAVFEHIREWPIARKSVPCTIPS